MTIKWEVSTFLSITLKILKEMAYFISVSHASKTFNKHIHLLIIFLMLLATVHGSGHMVPATRPSQSFQLIKRFLSQGL
jgi:hypothetical protein